LVTPAVHKGQSAVQHAEINNRFNSLSFFVLMIF